MNYFDVNHQTYAYCIHQQHRELPFLLMLHGFMGDHRVFDHLIDELCEFCNPVTIDLLGYGESAKPHERVRYQEHHQISDLTAFIRFLDVDRLFLHGYSMGGRLALKTALAVPEFLRGLILESTNCGISDKQQRQERQRTDEKRARQIIHNFDQFLNYWRQLALFQSPIAVDKTLKVRYATIQNEQSPAALAASLRGFGTGRMTPSCHELSTLQLPVLLLAGSADEKYQKINQRLVQKFPNADFSRIEAGHRVHLDNPSDFVSELNNYIGAMRFNKAN